MLLRKPLPLWLELRLHHPVVHPAMNVLHSILPEGSVLLQEPVPLQLQPRFLREPWLCGLVVQCPARGSRASSEALPAAASASASAGALAALPGHTASLASQEAREMAATVQFTEHIFVKFGQGTERFKAMQVIDEGGA